MPLVLDGDGLALQALRIDGVPVSETAYTATPDRLELAAPPVETLRVGSDHAHSIRRPTLS